MKNRSRLLGLAILSIFAVSSQAWAGGYWTAQVSPGSGGDFGLDQVILGDKFAKLITGSFETTDFYYTVSRNGDEFILTPFAPEDSYFKAGKEVRIKLNNPKEKGTLTEALAKTKAGIEIIGSPDGHGEKFTVDKFTPAEQDVVEYLDEFYAALTKPVDPDAANRPGTPEAKRPEAEPAKAEPVKENPTRKPSKLEWFVRAEVSDGPKGDYDFASITISERHAILRVGSFEQTDYLYTVTKDGSGYVLKPLKTEGGRYEAGKEMRVELVKPTKKKALMSALLEKGQGLRILGRPDEDGEGIYEVTGFTKTRLPHCVPYLMK